VSAIESELTQLWKAAAGDTLEGQPVVRACVLNLVAYAPGDTVAQHINEVISQVSGRHPSRSIVIVAEPDGKPAPLRASISAHCQIPPAGGKQVCSEQITIRAAGAALDEVHGSVLPLLIPDLPVFLWWHDMPSTESPLFRELVDSSEHFVVDSAEFAPDRWHPALTDLLRLIQEGDVTVSDFNWSRLAPWRDLVAQLFDAPPARRYLEHLDAVTIGIASNVGRWAGPTQSLLLTGWLASRLDWRFENGAVGWREGSASFPLKSGTGTVLVELREGAGHRGDGLQSIQLRAGGEATFSITRETDEEGCVLVAAEMLEGGRHSRVVHMAPPSEAALLSDELDALGRDVAFEDALAKTVRLTAGRP
jgi:glucose-6-phosphate dehydrogenase assembly protein OpcA